MESHGKYLFGPFLLDTRERLLQRGDEPVALTPKSFDLLTALVEHPGRLLTKDELLHKVWPDTFVEESNLAYNVFALRKALSDLVEHSQFIETVPKRGYRFIAAVTPVITDALPLGSVSGASLPRGAPFRSVASMPAPLRLSASAASAAALLAATAIVYAWMLWRPRIGRG